MTSRRWSSGTTPHVGGDAATSPRWGSGTTPRDKMLRCSSFGSYFSFTLRCPLFRQGSFRLRQQQPMSASSQRLLASPNGYSPMGLKTGLWGMRRARDCAPSGQCAGMAVPLHTVFQHLKRDLMIPVAMPEVVTVEMVEEALGASSCRPLPGAGSMVLTLGTRLPWIWGRTTLQPLSRRSVHHRAHRWVAGWVTPTWRCDVRCRKCWRRVVLVPAASLPHRLLRPYRWPLQHRKRQGDGGSTTFECSTQYAPSQETGDPG